MLKKYNKLKEIEEKLNNEKEDIKIILKAKEEEIKEIKNKQNEEMQKITNSMIENNQKTIIEDNKIISIRKKPADKNKILKYFDENLLDFPVKEKVTKVEDLVEAKKIIGKEILDQLSTKTITIKEVD